MIKSGSIIITKEDIIGLLGNYCERNQPDKAKSILKKYPQYIDLADCDGFFAIAIDRGFVDILQCLIDSYTETKLQGPKEGREYKVAYHTLQFLLNSAKEGTSHPVPEIQEILDQYISEENYSERDEIMEEDRVWPEHEEATTEERNSGDSVRNDEIETMPLTMINLYLKDHSDEFPKAETIDSKLIGDTL